MDHPVKDRLTGAIILVVLMVLLVPELLSGAKGPARAVPAATSSSSEELPLRSYTIDLADEAQRSPPGTTPAMPQAASDSAPGAATITADTATAAIPESAAPQPSIASTSNTSSLPAPAPASTAPSAATPVAVPKKTATRVAANAGSAKPHAGRGAFVVQLGVFASRENAERLAQEVRGKGFKATVTPLSASARKLFRVGVGPAGDRAAAAELHSRLRAAGWPGGSIVPNS